MAAAAANPSSSSSSSLSLLWNSPPSSSLTFPFPFLLSPHHSFPFPCLSLSSSSSHLTSDQPLLPSSVPPFPLSHSLPVSPRDDTLFSDSDDYDDEADVRDDDETYDVVLEDLLQLEDPEEEDEEDDTQPDFSDVHPDAPRKTSEMRKKVLELCRKRQEDPGYCITSKDLSSLYDFRIDKFQRLAVEGFLKGSSVVVCAPTSSGKTLIAECAAAASFAMQKRLFYTTPLKALSNQKFREFRDIFGEDNVGILTGDAAVNRDAPILIMTTEILRNMLYQIIGTPNEGDQLRDVGAVVLDEVHYLSDISRGTVWEETIIYCPKKIQLICLSATVANPEELAGWIGQVHGPTELVTSRRRPVPLNWHFSTRFSLSPLLNEDGTKMNRRLSLERHISDEGGGNYDSTRFNHATRNKEKKSHQHSKGNIVKPPVLSEDEMQFLRRRQVPRAEETLKQLKYRGMLPAIWFIFSRKGCDTAIRYVQDAQLLSEDEQQQVYRALETFRKEHPDAVRESAVSALLCGFAAHHAGCLPLWKTFIEELFQKGLIKVVFATETLAAGINMPARTTVLSSLSKRGDTGHALLSSNSMLQMAGRAGRRGLDERGHVVLVQTPFEGAEEACKLLFAGPDPLVSQFSASYGMVLNLLSSMKSSDGKVLRKGRTLEEACALIEQSFGNYVGNEVKVEALKEIARIDAKIAQLESEEVPDVKSLLSEREIQEYMGLKERMKAEKDLMKELRRQSEAKKLLHVQPRLLEAISKQEYPSLSISYFDAHSGNETVVYVLCVSVFTNPSTLIQEALVDFGSGEDDDSSFNISSKLSLTITDNERQSDEEIQFFLGLGSDNFWYVFSATTVHSMFQAERSEGFKESIKDILIPSLPDESDDWDLVGRSGKSYSTYAWSLNGSMDTLFWSRKVPVNDGIEQTLMPDEVVNVVKTYKEQRKKVLRIKKEMKSTKASKEYWNMVGQTKLRDAKVVQLKRQRSKLATRIDEMQPTGWQEFLQVVKVLEETQAIMPQTHEMLPLGRVAASVRGVNELWLALAFSENSLKDLNPAQLASVCACFVSDGVKIRPQMGMSDIYHTSTAVDNVVDKLREKQQWLYELQNKLGVSIPCELEDRLAGLVEAWASGVTWRELMMGCSMDEGDLARLLRRTIDLLAQLPSLPNMDPLVCRTATSAADVMDRSPISELIT